MSEAPRQTWSDRLNVGGDLHRAVLGSLPAHIAVLDPHGVIVATNDAWDRFAQENGGDAGRAGAATRCGIGADYLEVCRCAGGADAKESGAVYDGVRAVLDGSLPEFRLDYPCHAPHCERWYLLTVTPLKPADEGGVAGANGRAAGVVIAHFEITTRVKAEQSLARRAAEYALIARRLKKTNEELDQFAYITSHDLRAPLRGIANLSRWIEEDIGEHFTPESHRQMELLRGRVHRMEAMIDGILEYSRVGRVRQRSEQIDVAVLLAEVIDLLDVPPRFTVDVAPGMPVIFGEKLRLQQVFQNLIGNAVKYHDKPTGTISIGWREPSARGRDGDGAVEQPLDRPGEWVEFSVSDDGPGIEPQYHEKIFVIFQTLAARDKVEGTGLGLSLVRKVVESQGGSVWVESAPGAGATFRFTWPRQHGTGGAAGAARDGSAAAKTSDGQVSETWKTAG